MTSDDRITRIKAAMTDYPDFPKKGIIFKDIMGILQSPSVFSDTIDWFYEQAKSLDQPIDVVVGLEARGFLFGPSLAQKLGVGFVPVRKSGKLPGKCISEAYVKEYGEDRFEMQADAIKPGASVLIVDDLVAVGGTMQAAVRLMQKVSAKVVGCIVIVELSFLGGRQKVEQSTVLKSLVQVQNE